MQSRRRDGGDLAPFLRFFYALRGTGEIGRAGTVKVALLLMSRCGVLVNPSRKWGGKVATQAHFPPPERDNTFREITGISIANSGASRFVEREKTTGQESSQKWDTAAKVGAE